MESANVSPMLTGAVNADVRLGDIDGHIGIDGQDYPTRFTATMRLRQGCRLVLSGEFETGSHPLALFGANLDAPTPRIRVQGAAEPIPVLITNLRIGGERPAQFEATPMSGGVTVGRGEKCCRLQFTLINFPGFLVQAAGRGWNNYVRLVGEHFYVTIEGQEGLEDRIKTLRREGGFALTHSCTIERRDGSEFSFEMAQAELQKVHYFLSFVRGDWVGLGTVEGICDKDVEWWEWPQRSVGEWSGLGSWFDRDNAQSLQGAFAGFSKLWDDGYWRDVLRSAIYWYIRANGSGGVDAGIILGQAALERLSWASLVEATGRLSESGFRRLEAADTIRLGLSTSAIPLDVPESLVDLRALASAENWDGPASVTAIRNHLVHPPKPRFREARLPYAAVWDLTLWYVELLLLRAFDFREVYRDRTKRAGGAEYPPWVDLQENDSKST